MKATKFETVSQWIDAGHTATGFYLLSNSAKKTEKAIGFSSVSLETGRKTTAWFPQSQLIEIADDFYSHKCRDNFLVPKWLYDKASQKYDGL